MERECPKAEIRRFFSQNILEETSNDPVNLPKSSAFTGQRTLREEDKKRAILQPLQKATQRSPAEVDAKSPIWKEVGKVRFDTNNRLGIGCMGTIVYRGQLDDGREVAVKRVIIEFHSPVEREVELLRASDSHPNIIRYFCTETDNIFHYLVLELCVASLHEYMENRDVSDRVKREPAGSELLISLEWKASNFLTNNWTDLLDDELKNELRKYDVSSVRDLLRAIRNTRHHFSERSEEVRDSLGAIPNKFVNYFTSRFPHLLHRAYRAMERCSMEPMLIAYYPHEIRLWMRDVRREKKRAEKRSSSKSRASIVQGTPTNAEGLLPKPRSHIKANTTRKISKTHMSDLQTMNNQ